MSRAEALQATVERAKDRARYCQAQFSRYCSSFHARDPAQVRTHRKLAADLERAQRDVAWAQNQLDAAMDVEGLTL